MHAATITLCLCYACPKPPWLNDLLSIVNGAGVLFGFRRPYILCTKYCRRYTVYVSSYGKLLTNLSLEYRYRA